MAPAFVHPRFEGQVNRREESTKELRHDMANVLSLLQLRLSMLKRACLLDDDQTAVLEECLARLRALLDCWKEVETNENTERIESFDLYDVTSRIIEAYQPIIDERRQKLDFLTHPGPGKIVGPRILYERLVDNLISNASKYTPEGGQLQITIQLDISHIRLEVRDTGIGMDQNEIRRIFDRYYRTESAQLHTRAGTGLGLHIVKEIVDCLGGEIAVHSQIDSGSTFVVMLPTYAYQA